MPPIRPDMDVYAKNRKRLENAGVSGGEGDLCALIAYETGLSYGEVRKRLLLSGGCDAFFEVTDAEIARRIDADVCRRLAGEPVQYITGETDFYGRTFFTSPGVLIPRFDTECVVDVVLEHLKPHGHLLDLCCGSGCIGLTAALCRDACVTLVDVSEAALALSKKNAAHFGVDASIVRCDVLTDRVNGLFDLVVSNPPYIPTRDLDGLSVEVKNEPMLALDGGEDGLLFYRRIAPSFCEVLRPGGFLVFEVGIGEASAVLDILQKSGYRNLETRCDYGGIERVVFGQKEF